MLIGLHPKGDAEMRIKYFYCGICNELTGAHGHCKYCGATRIVVDNRPRYYNLLTHREVVRGAPGNIDKVIVRVVRYAEWKDEQNNRDKTQAHVNAAKASGDAARKWREEQRALLGL